MHRYIGTKPMYYWELCDWKKIEPLLRSFKPFLSARRNEKADELLNFVQPMNCKYVYVKPSERS